VNDCGPQVVVAVRGRAMVMVVVVVVVPRVIGRLAVMMVMVSGA
jgi:hypothetical protein